MKLTGENKEKEKQELKLKAKEIFLKYISPNNAPLSQDNSYERQSESIRYYNIAGKGLKEVSDRRLSHMIERGMNFSSSKS